MSKDILDESRSMNTLSAKSLTDIPSKMHNINAFKLCVNLYGRYLL